MSFLIRVWQSHIQVLPMNKSIYFIRMLLLELNEWVSSGIITEDQRNQIAALYREEPAVPTAVSSDDSRRVVMKDAEEPPKSRHTKKEETKPKEPINIARVVIGLASFCLAVGIIIFYASNWRAMPPIAKIIQVFLLIITTNGLAYVILSRSRAYPMIGRALLLIGMICYGAGIMLIAQIYHISAEPSTGVLAWAIGSLAMSALMCERYGCWLSMVLFFIWNCMELFIYGNPVFAYIIPVLVIGYLLFRERDRIGTIVSTVLFGWYFFQANIYVIYHYAVPGWKGYLFIAMFVALGTALVYAGTRISRNEFLATPGKLISAIGILAYFLPVIQMSHFSSRSAHDLLVWAVSSFASALILRSRVSLYLSMGLFFTWNIFSVGALKDPNWFFVIPIALLAFLSYRLKEHAGIVITAVLFGWYFFQTNFYVIFNYAAPGLKGYCFIAMFVALGTALVFLGKRISKYEFFDIPGKIITGVGICAYFLPLVQMSHLESGFKYGFLVWAIASFVSSLLLRWRVPFFLSAVLFFIWNIFAINGLHNANWFFIIPVVVFAILSFLRKDKEGLILSVCFFGWYLMQIGAYSVITWAQPGIRSFAFIILFTAIGGAIRYASKFIDRIEYARDAGMVWYACGWLINTLALFLIIHVNAPDSYSLLVFASVVLALELILREGAGLFVSAALFFAWSVQSTWISGVIPLYYAAPVLVIGYLFYRIENAAGVVLSSFAAVYFLVMMTCRFALPLPSSHFVFMMMALPIGALLIISGRAFAHDKLLRHVRDTFTLVGWTAFASSFVLISWPLKMKKIPYLPSFSGSVGLSVEYCVILALIALFLIFLRRKGESLRIFGFIALFAAAAFFVPFAHTPSRMIALHIGIILASLIVLYNAYVQSGDYERERAYGMIFTAGLLLVKGFGFIGYGMGGGGDNGYKLAYLIGFILFAVVIFLVNRLVHHLVTAQGKSYPVAILDVLCAISVWFTVFLSSFEISNQRSVFEADSVVIIMIVLFVVIAALLYGYLLAKLREGRSIVYLSFVIFVASGITLFVAKPDMSWAMYSVVFNLLLLLISIVCIYYSTVIQSRIILNIAIGAFILHVVVRYFDLFWNMLSGSLLFIVTGIIGLAGGFFLERKRRTLLDKMDKPSHKTSRRVSSGASVATVEEDKK